MQVEPTLVNLEDTRKAPFELYKNIFFIFIHSLITRSTFHQQLRIGRESGEERVRRFVYYKFTSNQPLYS